ncbi:MAG: hypothetical protein KKB74_04960, partial [Bacteroidetes bacterium]|nr:hypothetical protein [Bacteroidota bacterium]
AERVQDLIERLLIEKHHIKTAKAYILHQHQKSEIKRQKNLIIGENPSMARWRSGLFIFMSRNAANVSTFFSLPVDQVIEIGIRLEI